MLLFKLTILLNVMHLTELSDYEYLPDKSLKTADELDIEPVVPENIDRMNEIPVSLDNGFNCEDFESFKDNLTMTTMSMYNSSRRSPPSPWKISDWCRSLRYVTNRAIDWNSECRDVTNDRFNIETLKGHLHVIDHVCDDQTFLNRYNDLTNCVVVVAGEWEMCYVEFKEIVDDQKNTTHEWTHFETHFYLCCAKALFRRCTLEAIHRHRKFCTHDQALTLQKFSVIVSEGEVYQNCELNVQYTNCPNGDPRPTGKMLYQLVFPNQSNSSQGEKRNPWLILLLFVTLCFDNIHF